MDRLRQLLSQINAQLAVLSVSQRIAVGLCAALAAMSILWLMQWSTKPELVQLVPYSFSYEELPTVEEALNASGKTYEVRGMRVYVRQDDKRKLQGELSSAGALPDGSLFSMEQLVAEQNPFLPPSARAENANYAKANDLGNIIATFEGVKHARVILNPKTKRRFGGASDVPTASVAITLSPGREMTQSMIGGVAKLVAGTVPGLKPHNVFITDNRGRPHRLPNPEDAVGLGYLDEVKKREAHLLNKIMDKLAYIPGLRASVSVRLDSDRRTTQKTTYAKQEVKTDMTDNTVSGTASSPAASGMQPNVGTAITATAAGQSNTTDKTELENFPAKVAETQTIESGLYAQTGVTATVGIPRSFIVGLHKLNNPDAQDPTDADIASIRDEQKTSVRTAVAKMVMADSLDDVEVDVFPDMQWSSSGGNWSPPGGPIVAMGMEQTEPGAVDYVVSYGPQLGLGVLAMMSMFMMMRIVRKSSKALADEAAVDEEPEVDEGRVLTVGPHAVGQAEATDGFLTGKEVDEDTLKFRQLDEEVSRLVREDPGVAADLIGRWVEETE